MAVANTLDNYDTAIITAVKSFIVQRLADESIIVSLMIEIRVWQKLKNG